MANEVHLPHVRHIVAQLNNHSQMTPNCQNILIGLLGRTVVYLTNSGTLQGIEEFAKMAVSISEKINGPKHPDTATTLNNFAELLDNQQGRAAIPTGADNPREGFGTRPPGHSNNTEQSGQALLETGQVQRGEAALPMSTGDP
ncbi:hypothetical protein BC936DRAFT_138595 [Jimgerdemannia flammicorona]|uniref:Kinesin light chain n=1 Tax=Jimgerdemannia flammicorona TaxID=994334 RepID=A0A433DIG3_9FUNG|nr:hypothetical protein BC936DRAFT_138595 [Jimgerdemannia flammicorona]